MRTASQRYGNAMLTLHWGMAAMILGAVALVYLRNSGIMDKALMMELHRSLGVTLVALVAVRAALRFASPPPPMPDSMPGWMELAATGAHVALYALMIAIPVTGIVMTWAAGKPLAVWGLGLPTLLLPDPALARSVKDMHEVLGNAMLAVVGLHAGAALFHQYVMKDGLLARMVPCLAKAER